MGGYEKDVSHSPSSIFFQVSFLAVYSEILIFVKKLQEYEDWDEYETDGEEQEEEDVDDDGYERVHKPTQEELDYLAIRQRLKESIRKQMKKDTGTANPGSRDKVNSSRRDK